MNVEKFNFCFFQSVCQELCGSTVKSVSNKQQQQQHPDPGPDIRQRSAPSLYTKPCLHHQSYTSVPQIPISTSSILQFLQLLPASLGSLKLTYSGCVLCYSSYYCVFCNNFLYTHIFVPTGYSLSQNHPVDTSSHLTTYFFTNINTLSLHYTEVQHIMEVDQSSMSLSPPRSPRPLRPSTLLEGCQTPKRRRVNSSSLCSSGTTSPVNLCLAAELANKNPRFRSLCNDDVSSDISNISSMSMSPCSSPSAFRNAYADFHEKYKKDELWASIRSDYHYIMDKEIIEACKVCKYDPPA